MLKTDICFFTIILHVEWNSVLFKTENFAIYSGSSRCYKHYTRHIGLLHVKWQQSHSIRVQGKPYQER